MKRIIQTLVFFVIYILSAHNIYAYTWFIEGEWKYIYYSAYNNYFWAGNNSNTQEIIRSGKDGTVVMNKAVMKPSAGRTKYPMTIPAGFENDLSSSYAREEDKQFIRDYAVRIIGDAQYVDEAVWRIGNWVRKNVSYQLGAPTDAIGVIKSGRAFCVGYAEVAVELLRAAGIPARTLSCYVPRGCGWGFGNEGGNHAFLEFYTPDTGWVSFDPQSSMGFSDPYHLVNAGFKSEIKRIDDTYITDMQDEPKEWELYLSSIHPRQNYPALIFKIRDTSGSYVRDDIVRFTNLPNDTGWKQGVHSDWGMKILIYNSKYYAITSAQSKYFTLIFTGGEFQDKSFRERIFIPGTSFLYTGEIDFHGRGKYFVNADFYDGNDVKRILVTDDKDQPLINKPLFIKIGNDEFVLKTDRDGMIHIISDIKKINIKMDEKDYNLTLDRPGVIRLLPRDEKQGIVDEYIRSNGLEGKDALLLVFRDRTGTISSRAFENVILVQPGGKQVKLDTGRDGITHTAIVKPGNDCAIVCRYRNFYIRRNISRLAPGINRVEISASDAKFISLDVDETESRRITYFEYLPGGGTIEYVPVLNRVYLSLPDGDFYFSDNPDFKDVTTAVIGKNTTSLKFHPEQMTDSLNRKVNEFLFSGKNVATGYIVSDSVRAKEAAVYIINRATGKITAGEIDRGGYFRFSGFGSDEKFILVYPRENSVIMRELNPGNAQYSFTGIDAASMKEFRLYTGEKGWNGTWKTGTSLVLCVPLWKNGRLEFSKLQLKNSSGNVRIITDGNDYWFCINGAQENLLRVTGSGQVKEYYYPELKPGERNGFDERIALYSSVYTGNLPGIMLYLESPDGTPLAGKRVLLNDGKNSREYNTDTTGMLFIPDMQSNKDYSIIYIAEGIYLEHHIKCDKSGVIPFRLILSEIKPLKLTLENYDGYVWRSIPFRDEKNRLLFDNRLCRPDKKNELHVYMNMDVIHFRFGYEYILKAFKSGSGKTSIDYRNIKSDPCEIYKNLVSGMYPGETTILLHISNNNVVQRNSRFKITGIPGETGDTGRDGVFFATCPGMENARFSISDYGIYVSRDFVIKTGSMNFISYDIVNNANLLLEWIGDPARIINKSVYLYSDAVFENGILKSYKEKICLKGDRNGKCFAWLSGGEYYIETGVNEFRKVKAGNSLQKVKIEVK